MWRLLVVAVVSLSACSLLTQFDPETEPCDLSAPVGEQCLPGFRCERSGDAGVCVRGDGSFDAGTEPEDAGVSVDAGP